MTVRDVFFRHRMSTVLWREAWKGGVRTRTRCVGCGYETEDPAERGDHLVSELERWVDEHDGGKDH